eukprot:TRINITY_DN75476_c0_g1_i1.p1 TRINITY_DN75476_c0_g1~~TRINITY_DN75476_c0_g1_i1.p1  ORF type:complete len:337 (-),score=122.19 TRINITY_DN75476_c0_g1_i1:215-1225(-)
MLSQILVLLVLLLVHNAAPENKYSASANGFYPDSKGPIKSYAGVENPFRMQKVNLLWEKSRTKLTESKLEKLYSELKVQDKDELTLKKLRGEGSDKDGSKEAEVRKKFNSIMLSYGLGGTPDNTDSPQTPAKALFKDKKLQRLWDKAEQAGLVGEELIALQEEFKHHQRKVDEYNTLLELVGDRDSKRYNEIKKELKDEEFDIRDTNEVTRKAKEMKQNYDRLHRLATNQGEEHQFGEPKVAGLWKLALMAKFEPEELESLREELGHYERRLEKMQFIRAELQLVEERHGGKFGFDDDDKMEGRRIMDKKLSKHTEAVAKLHESLESKIMARHNEL